MNIVVWELRSKRALFSKLLPRPNHYAHWIRIEILSKTPVSILRDLPPQPQNLGKTSNNNFLKWMSTLISKWQQRRRPNNSGHLAEPWSNVPRNQISRSGNPSLRQCYRQDTGSKLGVLNGACQASDNTCFSETALLICIWTSWGNRLFSATVHVQPCSKKNAR